ncbi:hypothetical protein ACIA6E_01225 [Streptomyces sp. NPDC051815]|uniref:hypothetical protein n=1 Tax=Streptomyces sp. NPDC051815 TaxID=3365674 RepID=UPI0037B18568
MTSRVHSAVRPVRTAVVGAAAAAVASVACAAAFAFAFAVGGPSGTDVPAAAPVRAAAAPYGLIWD